MYRIYEVQRGERRLIGGTPTLKAAQAIVLRIAGNPIIPGPAMGSYRGPNEFLPRCIGSSRFEIIEEPGVAGEGAYQAA